MGTITTRLTIPTGHPALAGHFPGNLVVPGVVVLDEVIAAATRSGWVPAKCVVKAAKFLSPVRGGDELTIRLQARAGDALRFDCSVGVAAVATGTLHPGNRDMRKL